MLVLSRAKNERLLIGDLVLEVTNVDQNKKWACLSVKNEKQIIFNKVMHPGETYALTDTITIGFKEVNGFGHARIGINAPRSVNIVREEVANTEQKKILNSIARQR